MRHLLMVAYYFPPIGGIGSIRLARFAAHLPDLGWEVTVLTPRDTPHPQDPRLVFPERRVLRSRSIEASHLRRLIPGGHRAGTGDGGGGMRATLRARGRMLYPDPQIGWFPGAMVAGLRAFRRDRFDAIFSSSFPITAHLVARRLRRRAGLPWVAEFRDPWSEALPEGHPFRGRAAALERSIASEAVRVVMPTPSWAEHFGTKWGTKVAVVPNGYDPYPADFAPPAVTTLTHLGSFYPDRQDLAPLWEAIAQLAEKRGTSSLRIRFIGDLPPEVAGELRASGLWNLVEVTGFVTHDRAMELVSSSSLLFACGQTNGGAFARGWIPAKLFEYLGSSLPILYLGDSAGDAARLLEGQPGCFVAPRNDSALLAAALEAGVRGERFKRDVESLSRWFGARTLGAVLDEAVRRD